MTALQVAFEIYVQATVPDPVGEECWQAWFRTWLADLEVTTGELTLRLTDTAEVQALNRQFRSVDAPTDVLSFTAEADAFEEVPYLGDIVVSVPVATGQSVKFGHSIETELAWLAVHGLLHLLGWDHPDDQAWQDMVLKQTDLLKGVGVEYDWPRVYSTVG